MSIVLKYTPIPATLWLMKWEWIPARVNQFRMVRR